MGDRATHSFAMRPLASKDIEKLAAWFQDLNDLAMFDRSAPIPVGPEAVEKLWKDDLDSEPPRTSYWYIGEDDDGEPLGICGIRDINYVHGDGTIPLFVAKAARGRGVGMEMGARMLNLAFDNLRLRRVSTFHRVDNKATEVLIKKLGFSHEGVVRQAWFTDGNHIDIALAGILQEEWAAHRDTLPSLATMDGQRHFKATING